VAVQTSAKAELPTETRRTVYARRVPEDTVLYGVVSDQLRTFFSDAESAGREVPAFVARRMADTAAFLVDRVIPHVPVHQWVLSLPITLRYKLAYDSALAAAVL